MAAAFAVESPKMRASVLRSMAAAGCCALAGCSSLGGSALLSSFEDNAVPTAALGQPTAAIVHSGLQSVVTEAKLKPPLQASRLRRGPSSSVDPWVACVRSGATEASKRLAYAVYFTPEAYSRSRLSTLADACEGEVFSGFK